MAAGKYSFTIEQGATLDFEIKYKDGNGDPVDLSGYTAAMEIRSNYSGSGETYLRLTSSLGDTYEKLEDNTFISLSGSNLVTPITSGSIGIYAGWETLNTLDFTEPAYYDIEITKHPIRTRILEGRVTLSKQTTD